MTERYPWEDDPTPEPEPAPAPESPWDGAPAQLELEQQPVSDEQPLPPAGEATPAPLAADAPPQLPPRAPAEAPRAAPRERAIARKEYYSIGEVSDLAGLPAHVLRYWESQFPVLNPSKNRSGNRAYQRKEIKLILLVKHLLYEEKYTIEGAKAKLDQLRRGGLLAEQTARALDVQTLALLRDDVARLRELLATG